jgi:FMN phosphatase YigB (HAD superfamily)
MKKLTEKGDEMINWILGAIIAGVTAFIVVWIIRRMRKGGSICCGDCTENKCNCSK